MPEMVKVKDPDTSLEFEVPKSKYELRKDRYELVEDDAKKAPAKKESK